MKRIISSLLLLSCLSSYSQYQFGGQLPDSLASRSVYLSLVEDYHRSGRVYLDQVVQTAITDSLGRFYFRGNTLPEQQRIYRIHTDNCQLGVPFGDHLVGRCSDIESVLFLAHNRDTLFLPFSDSGEVFCEINSTNDKASLLLDIEALKEDFFVEFATAPGESARTHQLRNWFQVFVSFGRSCEESLAELYIFDFLSDKRSDTYSIYLEQVGENPYFGELLNRLNTQYPGTAFSRLYEAEITTDRQLAARINQTDDFDRSWFYAIILILFALNLVLIWQWRKAGRKAEIPAELLTVQEQKIVSNILEDKTNKEIAAELFVSHSTVKTHINNLYKKLGVNSRQEIKSRFQK